MKKVIRRVYSNFSETPEQTQRPRKKRKLLKALGAVAGAGALGAGAYYGRNTKAGLAVRGAAGKARASTARTIYSGMNKVGSTARNATEKMNGVRGSAARTIYSGINKAKDGANRVIKKFKKN